MLPHKYKKTLLVKHKLGKTSTSRVSSKNPRNKKQLSKTTAARESIKYVEPLFNATENQLKLQGTRLYIYTTTHSVPRVVVLFAEEMPHVIHLQLNPINPLPLLLSSKGASRPIETSSSVSKITLCWWMKRSTCRVCILFIIFPPCVCMLSRVISLFLFFLVSGRPLFDQGRTP
jgi:hypothetical protein